MVATKIALEVPADPIWRHVIAATLLAAVRAIQAGVGPRVDRELSEMGDLSMLLDQALDQIEGLPGVTTLLIEVEPDGGSAQVTVAGSGGEVEPPIDELATDMPILGAAAFAGPLTSNSFAWDQSAISCSFRIP